MGVPSETLLPTFTVIFSMTPVRGDGTSIVALSDSSTINGSSSFIESPGFTSTSITGTSLKSPISGIEICLHLCHAFFLHSNSSSDVQGPVRRRCDALKSPPALLRLLIDSHCHGIRFFRINAKFFYRLRHFLTRDFTVFGQGLEGGYGDVIAIHFKEPAQPFARVGTPKTVCA